MLWAFLFLTACPPDRLSAQDTTLSARAVTLSLARRFDLADGLFERVLAAHADLAAIRARAILNILERDGNLRAAQGLIPGLASEPDSIAKLAVTHPSIIMPLLRLAEPLQSSILGASPPNDTTARLGYFLAVGEALGVRSRTQDAGIAWDSARTLAVTLLAAHPYDDALHAAYAAALVGLGGCDDAAREAERATELMPVDSNAVTGTDRQMGLAVVEARCGRFDQSAVRLEFLLSRPAPVSRALLRADPVWTPMHGTTRYEKIVAGH